VHAQKGEETPLYTDAPALAALTGAAVAAISGAVGMVRVNECRRLRQEQELRRVLRPFEPRLSPPGGIDPWLAAGAPPEGFTAAPPQLASPDGGAADTEVGP
jgi:hypothetical protein